MKKALWAVVDSFLWSSVVVMGTALVMLLAVTVIVTIGVGVIIAGPFFVFYFVTRWDKKKKDIQRRISKVVVDIQNYKPKTENQN